ncbi:hypothetical protein DL93DRAFT_2083497 [Clavulina sp. PMI_390]|nr:hypothetical protein DL93DRAFT_2083497 [Clavulina sp. PMI_390]
MEAKARQRLRRVLPRSRSPTPEPPNLAHLRRSSTPPLVASYGSAPTINSADFTSFVLDPTVQHAFTSPHLATLQDTATELIAGEASTRKAFGSLWRVLQGNLQRRDPEAEEAGDGDEEYSEEREAEEREQEQIDSQATVRRRRGDASLAEVQPLAKLFVSPVPIPLGAFAALPGGIPATLAPNGPSQIVDPSRQLDTFEWCLGVLRELADHGKEYVSRLEELRNGLGEANATRSAVWTACRQTALDELTERRNA